MISDTIGYRLAGEISTKTLFPIHVEYPDVYNIISKNIMIFEKGVKYELRWELSSNDRKIKFK